MCHIVSKLCARCPRFFLVSLPYPLGSLAGALCWLLPESLTTARCWAGKGRNPPLTCLISPAGQLILLTPSFPSPLSFEKNKTKHKQNKLKKNPECQESCGWNWCTNLITRGGSDVTAPSGCAVLQLYWAALNRRIAFYLLILLELETNWHCLVIMMLMITLLMQLTQFSFGNKIVRTACQVGHYSAAAPTLRHDCEICPGRFLEFFFFWWGF